MSNPVKPYLGVMPVIEDDVFIPFDPDNRDYQEYLAWVAEGNTAEAAD